MSGVPGRCRLCTTLAALRSWLSEETGERMPFESTDASVGMVAYFSIDDLRGHKDLVSTGGSPDDKARPFVCYAKAGATLYFTPLTTQTTQSKRKPIPPAAIRNAMGRMKTEDVVVNDGFHTYSGAADAFAALSRKNDTLSNDRRPRILEDGIAIVVEAVKERGGQLP